MHKLMNSDDDENIQALYESLNPAKRSLLPLEYQAILRLKGFDVAAKPALPSLQGAKLRPPSGNTRIIP